MICDKLRRVNFAVGKFRVLMDIPPPFDHLRQYFGRGGIDIGAHIDGKAGSHDREHNNSGDKHSFHFRLLRKERNVCNCSRAEIKRKLRTSSCNTSYPPSATFPGPKDPIATACRFECPYILL